MTLGLAGRTNLKRGAFPAFLLYISNCVYSVM
nr:MAG TPA: hypothetical protein [Caudoviricetes sp.]